MARSKKGKWTREPEIERDAPEKEMTYTLSETPVLLLRAQEFERPRDRERRRLYVYLSPEKGKYIGNRRNKRKRL